MATCYPDNGVQVTQATGRMFNIWFKAVIGVIVLGVAGGLFGDLRLKERGTRPVSVVEGDCFESLR